MIIDSDDMRAGLERIGASKEAQLYLRSALMRILVGTVSPGLSDGAVRHEEGRRTLAAELIQALGLNREDGHGGRGDGAEHVGHGGGHDLRRGRGLERRVPLDPDKPDDRRR